MILAANPGRALPGLRCAWAEGRLGSGCKSSASADATGKTTIAAEALSAAKARPILCNLVIVLSPVCFLIVSGLLPCGAASGHLIDTGTVLNTLAYGLIS
jgi:hypothetical protein